MVAKAKLIFLLAGGSALAILGVTAVYAQVVTGEQDFSIVVEQGVDDAPDPFSFTALTERPLSRVFLSDLVTFSGMDDDTPLSITGGEYSLNGGEFASVAATVSAGDTIVLRVTSSQNYEEAVVASLTVGSVTEDFSVKTKASDACDGSMIAVGTTCFDGSVFAGTVEGERLFVAASNEGAMQWKTSRTYTPGTYSDDGLKNFASLKRLGLSEFPAAAACAAKGEDWYLPSLAEFNAIATNMSSANIADIFAANNYHLTSETWGTEKFGTALSGGTSTDNSGYVYAFVPNTGAGAGRVMDSAVAGLVHCVKHDGTREVPNDPCDVLSPEVGSLCADGTVYAGEFSGRKMFIATEDEGLSRWSTAEVYAPGTYGDDGFMNAGAMRQIGVESFPGMAACSARGKDWYLPSLAEFQAVRTNFGVGLRSHAFAPVSGTAGINQYHMTSESFGTGKGGTNPRDDVRFSYAFSPGNGLVAGRDRDATNNSYVHCFKAEGGRTYTDPCDSGTPATGSLCFSGAIYVTDLNSEPFYLAPQNEATTLRAKTTRTSTTGTTSQTDGLANTDAMIAAGNHPAAEACRARGPGWYLPARSEIDLAWDLSRRSVTHSFFGLYNSYHWTSTQYPSNNAANWVQALVNGGTENAYFKDTALQVRCAFKPN